MIALNRNSQVSHTPFGGHSPAPPAGGQSSLFGTSYDSLNYPGLPGHSYPGLPGHPAGGPAPGAGAGAGGGGGGGAGGLLGSLGNIRQMIDRMGGIDGVLEHVTKIQKIMSSVQQMAPMLKLLMGKKASPAALDEDDYVPRRYRRRRRRRRTGSSRRRPRR